MSRDIDPARSRAVLLGVSYFPRDPERLPGLPAVRSNLFDLARILSAPDVMGLPSEHIVTVDDRPSTEMLSRLAAVADEAEDTLMVYYAGHGLIGGTSLYLTGTDSSERTIEFDGMPFERLRKALSHSPARKKVLIIDCCYSGRATELMGTARAMLQANIDDIEGTYVLASSGATQASVAPDGKRHTAFTEELLSILEHGIPDAPPTLKLGHIYRELLLRLRRKPDLPDPQQSASKTAGEMEFAYNRAFVRAPEAPDMADGPAVEPAAMPAGDEPAGWGAELAARLDRQAQLIESLQRQLAQQSEAAAERLAHSNTAAGLAEEQAEFERLRSGQYHTVDAEAYKDMLTKQRERIEELEGALAAQNQRRQEPGDAVRPLGRRGKLGVLVAACLAQGVFLAMMIEAFPAGPDTTRGAPGILASSLAAGGVAFWAWRWLRRRYRATNSRFTWLALIFFIGLQVVLATVSLVTLA